MRPFLLLLALFAAGSPMAGTEIAITNPLALDWPWELVHRDLPAGTLDASAPLAAQIGSELRPVQCEALADGRQRAWFIATLAGKGGGALNVHIAPGSAESPLTVASADGGVVIANGIYRLRLPSFSGALSAPTALAMMAPPITACQLVRDRAWFGRSWFEGTALVSAARTEILARGPVFASVRITYELAAAPDGAPPARRGAEGMGGVAWPPADRPGLFYEVTLRLVAGDPWIDVAERCNLLLAARRCWRWNGRRGSFARCGDVDPLVRLPGLRRQCRAARGAAAVRSPSSARGVRRAASPLWNQQPGGRCQDFIVTRGLGADADPHAPAVGVIGDLPQPLAQPLRPDHQLLRRGWHHRARALPAQRRHALMGAGGRRTRLLR